MSGEDSNYATVMFMQEELTELDIKRLFPNPTAQDKELMIPRTKKYGGRKTIFMEGCEIDKIRLFMIREGTVEVGYHLPGIGEFVSFLTLGAGSIIIIPVDSRISEFTIKSGNAGCILTLFEAEYVTQLLAVKVLVDRLAETQRKILLEMCRNFPFEKVTPGNSLLPVFSLIEREVKERPSLQVKALELVSREVAQLKDFWDEVTRGKSKIFAEYIGNIEESAEELLPKRDELIAMMTGSNLRGLFDIMRRVIAHVPMIEEEQLGIFVNLWIKLSTSGLTESRTSYTIMKRTQNGIVWVGKRLAIRVKALKP